MQVYLFHFRVFFIRAVTLGLLLNGHYHVSGKMQVAVLYEDYHQRGESQVIMFDSCQNIPAEFNDKTSSLDPQGNCIRLYENKCCQGRSIELPVGSPLVDDLYNGEFDDLLSSLSPCGNYTSSEPAKLLQERWLQHSELLNNVFSDDDIVIYYDSEVSRSIQWPQSFVGDAWRYLRNNYNLDKIAGLTRNEKLHVIFHSGKAYMQYNSSALTYFDVSSECRNIIDISAPANITWNVKEGDQLDTISQQFGNLVIYLFRGGRDAPTFHYLDKNDAEFVNIITFDLYKGLNMPAEQERFFRKSLLRRSPGSSDTEKDYVNWFKDWYYPIYKGYGELNIIRKYLKLSAAYYPTVSATRHFNVTDVDSEHASNLLQMNLGEFVHFWSGVTHQNLQKLAVNAFGWNMRNEYQLIQAQRDFPKLSY